MHATKASLKAGASSLPPPENRPAGAANTRHAASFAASLKRAGQSRAARADASRLPQDVDTDSRPDPAPLPNARRQFSDPREGDSGKDQVADSVAPDGESFDATALADLLVPLCASDGLFELLSADGSTLSVAMTATAQGLRILLGSSAAATTARLRRARVELQHQLARRIGKPVIVTIL